MTEYPGKQSSWNSRCARFAKFISITGPWALGSDGEQTVDAVKRLNEFGIEFADERAVCAAITQEFVASRAASGLRGSDGKERFFEIEREVFETLKLKDGKKKFVDIVVKRRDGVSAFNWTLIEAKRARRWTVDLRTGKRRKRRPTHEEVAEDVCALENLLTAQTYAYVLVWGRDDDSSWTEYFGDVRKQVKMNQSN